MFAQLEAVGAGLLQKSSVTVSRIMTYKSVGISRDGIGGQSDFFTRQRLILLAHEMTIGLRDAPLQKSGEQTK